MSQKGTFLGKLYSDIFGARIYIIKKILRVNSEMLAVQT